MKTQINTVCEVCFFIIHFSSFIINLPIYQFINLTMRYIPELFGCLPQDDYDLEAAAQMQSRAVSLTMLHRRKTMPVVN
jgi:hypothetical protein